MTSTGVWLIGARGNIATTAIVGARAIARDEADMTGLVTEREPCSSLNLAPVDEFVFGGHDIRSGSVAESAYRLADRNSVPDRRTVEAVENDLELVDERIRPGTALNGGAACNLADTTLLEDEMTAREIVEQLRDDYTSFQSEEGLDQTVVVNVASTEPSVEHPDRYDSLEDVEQAIDEDDDDLPASVLYAYAALAEGHPYANFTPSAASSLGGLQELAEEATVPHMGNDGKTGESLVKAALAPMFAGRNLRVRSWEGHNILGNTDGEVLEDDANKAGKLASKGGILDGILDEPFHNRVRIDHTPSLGDWKTAWDDIRFDGFLGTRMKMQFTWEGSDSALAAPLVLDLVRLLDHADRHGEYGLQPHLASFFKAPVGVDEHDLSRQFADLERYVNRHVDTPSDGVPGEVLTD